MTHPLGPDTHLLNLARQGQRLPHLLVALVLSIVLVLLAQTLGILPLLIAFGEDAVQPPYNALGDSAVATGLMFTLLLIGSFSPVFLLLWLWLAAYEKRPFWTMGFEPGGALLKYLRGWLVGLLSFGAAVLLMAAFGMVGDETGLTGGQPGRQGEAALGGVALVTVGWAVQGASEELVCRGWLLPAVGARYDWRLGVLVSALLFAVLHALNPNVSLIAMLNIFLVGIFLAFYAMREGGLWGVCAWHSAWNWAQGNLFGFEVSGQEPAGGMLFNLMETGPDAVTGGPFGPEGGLAVTAILLAGTVMLYFLNRESPRIFANDHS